VTESPSIQEQSLPRTPIPEGQNLFPHVLELVHTPLDAHTRRLPPNPLTDHTQLQHGCPPIPGLPGDAIRRGMGTVSREPCSGIAAEARPLLIGPVKGCLKLW
jgi:hypothetical protein